MTGKEAAEKERLRIEEPAKLAGNASEYDVYRVKALADSPLSGKYVAVLGSSVARGHSSLEQGIGEALAARLGFSLHKETVSGTTLADFREDSYIRRMEKGFSAEERFDLFICQLSTNDARLGFPLGEIAWPEGEPDPKTVTGALEIILRRIQKNWDCPAVIFTSARYDSPVYASFVERLYALREVYDFGIIDLWTDEAFNTLDPALRSLYMADELHPTRAGYRDWWAPEAEGQLLRYLKSIEK